MAIQKEKTLASGITGNYWRITSINIDRQNLRIMAVIALFKDAAASASGLPPIGDYKTFNFNFTMAEFSASPNAIAFAYGKIIAHAQTMRTHDISGVELETPVYYDPDLADGTAVL